ncbi:hypothetical protein FHR38_004623 [Micromonospora polyrhachis]|uniref:Uncharacterized protein n=1 Tax=Micromonospora polyrhachis TaxID=1282883 RepID=A0A7W7WRB0_9ACTN|nr:hypothetical protein [Micromonospora polyrhachis]
MALVSLTNPRRLVQDAYGQTWMRPTAIDRPTRTETQL